MGSGPCLPETMLLACAELGQFTVTSLGYLDQLRAEAIPG